MYPYLNLGPLHLGMFGLLLWLAAVAAAFVLHRNFARSGVEADALSVVVAVVVAGIVGAKTWHELQDPAELAAAARFIVAPGWRHLWDVTLNFLQWFKAGFAWYGGLLGGIAALLWQGWQAQPNGMTGARAGVRMLDLAAPAAAVGYGVGRIGCLLSGDGDYGKNTTAWYGVHLSKDALVPPTPPDALVLPTPLWELGVVLAIAWVLWRLARHPRPLGWITGVYLVLTGVARFVVEFWRINPPIYHGLSNAQVASIGSVVVGAVVVLLARTGAPVAGKSLAESAIQT